MCLAQGPQRSDAGEARTRGPSVSSQALYHWATALPIIELNFIKLKKENIQCALKFIVKYSCLFFLRKNSGDIWRCPSADTLLCVWVLDYGVGSLALRGWKLLWD